MSPTSFPDTVLARARANATLVSVTALFFIACLVKFLRTDGDFDVYYGAALRFLHGASVHVMETNPFTYPATVAVLFAPFTILGHDAAKILFYVISFAALVLGVRLTNRELLAPESKSGRFVFAISMLFTLRFVLSALDNQQTDLIIFGLVTLGAWAYRDRPRLSAPAWALAAVLKLNPLFLVVVPAFQQRLRYVAAFLGVFVVLMLAPDLLRYAIGDDPMPVTVKVPTTVLPRDDIPATRELSLVPAESGAFAYLRGLAHIASTPGTDGLRWWDREDNPLNQSLTRIALHYLPPAVSPSAVFLVLCSLFALALLPLARRARASVFAVAILAYGAFVLIGPVASKPHFVAMYGLLVICWQQALRERSWPGIVLLAVVSGTMGLTTGGALGARAYDLATHGHIGVAALLLWLWAYGVTWRQSGSATERQSRRPRVPAPAGSGP